MQMVYKTGREELTDHRWPAANPHITASGGLKGRLERDLTADELRDRLQSLISSRRPGARRPATPVYEH